MYQLIQDVIEIGHIQREKNAGRSISPAWIVTAANAQAEYYVIFPRMFSDSTKERALRRSNMINPMVYDDFLVGLRELSIRGTTVEPLIEQAQQVRAAQLEEMYAVEVKDLSPVNSTVERFLVGDKGLFYGSGRQFAQDSGGRMRVSLASMAEAKEATQVIEQAYTQDAMNFLAELCTSALDGVSHGSAVTLEPGMTHGLIEMRRDAAGENQFFLVVGCQTPTFFNAHPELGVTEYRCSGVMIAEFKLVQREVTSRMEGAQAGEKQTQWVLELQPTLLASTPVLAALLKGGNHDCFLKGQVVPTETKPEELQTRVIEVQEVIQYQHPEVPLREIQNIADAFAAGRSFLEKKFENAHVQAFNVFLNQKIQEKKALPPEKQTLTRQDLEEFVTQQKDQSLANILLLGAAPSTIPFFAGPENFFADIAKCFAPKNVSAEWLKPQAPGAAAPETQSTSPWTFFSRS